MPSIPLPENIKPLHWAEWPMENTVADIACFGWLLVAQHYEGHLYETARVVMQAIVRDQLDAKYQMFQYAGKVGVWTAMYVNPDNPDDKLFVEGDDFKLTFN